MTAHRNARASRLAMIADPIDRGADGPAALARRLVQMPTDVAGVYCRQVVEAGPLAGLRLDQRQLDAAAELSRLWQEALPGRECPMGYGVGGRRGRHLSPEEERVAGDAARAYTAALDDLQGVLGVRGVIAVETTVIHHQKPHYPEFVPRALAVLADHFQIRSHP